MLWNTSLVVFWTGSSDYGQPVFANDNTAIILFKDLLPWSKYLLYLDRKQEELTQAW